MRILKKTLSFIIVIIMSSVLVININSAISASTSAGLNYRKITNIAIIFANSQDPFFALTKKSLQEIENENKDKVHFIFFDSQYNESIQNEIINSQSQKNIDSLVVYPVNSSNTIIKDMLDRAKQKNIPILLLGISSDIVSEVYKIYDKSAFITPNSEQVGMAGGNILANLWNNDKRSIDKNTDNVLQYFLLQGNLGNEVAIGRSTGSISALTSSRINTERLEIVNALWSEDTAKSSIENLFLKYGNKIEAIISNNDSMAIGAVKAIQKYGYNTGDKSKYIPIIGIDGLPEAKYLIDQGYMTGTVIQPTKIFATQIYLVGINLSNNLSPIKNTNYQSMDGQIITPFPIEVYTNKAS
ncbi:substrate-binding domain-containing protein [Clostridium sp. SHJSY1]|uniref:substrate-binding domain-containing protein n=1 Tax=Clostridium sp. SHJSY1 TaxID=2942483 RepID=UPI00287490BC|nr:substrate-binding domain-containing protein [Clostridium sp. SHJSY1]MDS0527162.1 substrate-binding domain-containing protein [Clostridium sp. SHJSY1]